MKTRYLVIYVVLAAILLAGCASTGSRREPQRFGDFVYDIYEFDGERVISIVQYHGTETDVIIPDVINGLPVTFIAGLEDKGLTSVSFPPGFIEIGDYAFKGNQLTSVTIPEGVLFIGDSAFADNQLTSLTIPEGVKEIGVFAFANNQLASVTMPEGVTEIGNRAFEGNQLTSVTIPDGVTKIGDYAFANNQLASVTIPDSVREIGDYAFEGNRLTSIIIPDSVTKISLGAFRDNQLTSVTIPDSVTEIGVAAFANNQLASVSIPEGVTEINGGAFDGNPLTSVTIPDRRIEFGQEPFTSDSLDNYLMPNGYPAGHYEKKGDTWHRNGEALTGLKARLACQRNDGSVFITKIDGVPGTEDMKKETSVIEGLRVPADLNWRYYKDRDIYLDAGFHTIEVAYMRLSVENVPYKEIIHTIYTKDGAEFEHALVLEGGTYDLTATEEDGQILFQIKRRP